MVNMPPILRENQAPTYCKPILEKVKTSSGERMLVRGVFGCLNERNENNRKYPTGVWQKNLGEESPLIGGIKERRILGELEHPESGLTHLARVSHVINEAQIEHLNEGNPYEVPAGDYVTGSYTILRTPMGQILEELHNAGVRVGVSSRGNGNVEPDAEGCEVVQEDYECDTWDAVYKPSVTTAYPTPVRESGENAVAAAKALVDLTEDQLQKMGTPELVEIASLVERATAKAKETDQADVLGLLSELKTKIAPVLDGQGRTKTESKTETKKTMPRSTEVNERKIDLVTAMAEQTVIQEARRREEGKCPKCKCVKGKCKCKKESEDKTTPADAKTKMVIPEGVDPEELVKALIKKGRTERSSRLKSDAALKEMTEQYDMAVQLYNGLLEKLRKVTGKPVAEKSADKGRSAGDPKKVVGKKSDADPKARKIESKETCPTRRVTEQKTDPKPDEPKTVHNPAKNRGKSVTETKKPKTLIGRVAERCDPPASQE